MRIEYNFKIILRLRVNHFLQKHNNKPKLSNDTSAASTETETCALRWDLDVEWKTTIFWVLVWTTDFPGGALKTKASPSNKGVIWRWLSKPSFSRVLVWSLKVLLASWNNIPAPGGEGGHYSEKDCLLGLLPLALKSVGCLFWPELSVGSIISSEACVEPEEVLMAGLELWLGASVSVWSATTTDGCSLGLRPLFLPEVAPFLTSAFIPWFSTTLVLLVGAACVVAAARNQF